MNIVFDLGGVVVRWDPDALVAGVFDDPADRRLARRDIIGHPDWLALDRGTLTRDDAIVRGAQRTGLSAHAVEQLFAQLPPSLVPIAPTVDILYRLKARGHPLFCLSNMHLDAIAYLEQAHTFWEVFTARIVSCRLQLVKPEPEIYAHLLAAYSLEAANTVFVDDVEVNLTAAAAFGVRTIQFESALHCERELRALGCL